MKANLGFIDRGIRIFLVVLIADLYFMHIISGIMAIILLILAGFFLVTSLISFCPVYRFFGISSKKKSFTTKKINDDT